MNRLKLARVICSVFPPVISQRIRTYIFPRILAQNSQIPFSKKSITGSVFTGNTLDFHSSSFAVHGFFDWRNIVIANCLLEDQSGDIIEIGANIGTETLSFCDILRNNKGTVHAFEPLPDNFTALESLKSSCDNLKLYRYAISDEEKTVTFQIPPLTSSGTGKIISTEKLADGHNMTEIKALPLDNLINSFQDVKFISIDTEGHEPSVLRGSTKTIEKFRPAVLIEVSPQLLERYSKSNSSEIYDFFSRRNYECYNIHRFSISKVNDKILEGIEDSNWICIPNESTALAEKLRRELFIRSVVPWFLLKSLPSN